jgi:hypothetical protein
MKVQIVTLYGVSHSQRTGVTLRGTVTSVYPTLGYHYAVTSVLHANSAYT